MKKQSATVSRSEWTDPDWKNAIGLIDHLARCHRAAIAIPGVSDALTSRAEGHGPHMDRAFVFVDNLLWDAKCKCEAELQPARPISRLKQ